jgi:imidazolonepropionase-like amidohydrolase
MLRRSLIAVVIATGVVSAQVPQTSPPRVKALVGGLLIDGFAGPPIQNSVVLVAGDRISAVGQVGTLAVPAGAEVISTEGMTVLPGLWDMHVHTMIAGHADYDHWDKAYLSQFESTIMPASARQLLLAGVTSARDLGGPLEASINVRNRINEGKLSGATLYVSGPFIQHEPYPNTEAYRWGVKGPEDGRAKVKRITDAGVDVVKLIDQDQMTMDEVRAVVEAAHAAGKPVVAHAHRPDEIRRGLQVGVDCFEHTGLSTAPEYPADIMAMIEERTAKMSLGPLYWTPTIEGLLNYEYLRDNPEALDDPAWHEGLPDAIVADIHQSLAHPDRLPYFQLTAARRPTLARKFRQLREAGVVQLIGTDSGIPMNFHSQSTWRELDAWVTTLGVDPMTAIRAATYWPSVAMKVDSQVGTVSPGKYADIIAVRGDVLRYISLLQRVDIVIKHGARVK